MGEKLVIGPIDKGLKKDRTAFNIDNDSFPTLLNAYQWRGRIKRKRGTSLLNRLSRFIGTTDGAGNLVVTILPIPILPGISSFVIGTDIFTDPGGSSPVNLITNSSGTGVLDRTTGVLTITGSQAATAVIYYPTLPVMGLRDFTANDTVQFPGTIGFDTRYAYNITTAFPYPVYDISFYKNPIADPINLPGYVPKTNATPVSWNGQDYQQFWTVNYQGAMWTTNGITIPFTIANIGMQFASPGTTPALTAAAWVNPTTMTFTIVGNPLVVGDFVFVNEFIGGSGLNFQTGYVTVAGNTFTVVFPNATIANAVYTVGMVQYLTNRSDVTKDGIRWYDGDPTNGSATAPVVNGHLGWVNFAPPLSQRVYSIANEIEEQYYLVGARMIVPFKDRLCFLGPVIQTSSPNSQIYLKDTIIYSQNGTPYYTASYTNTPSATVDTPSSVTNVFHPILVPEGETSSPAAYFEDQTGFGGFITAGIEQEITTASFNEDVLLVGFTRLQTRVVYSGNDIVPFNFFIINSELGSASTFSAINMDKGALTRGSRGFIVTSQTGCQRFDLDIPDEVFQIDLLNNGNERVCSQRDYISEWVYFTYPVNQINYKFPTQTLQYNYRDNSWAVFRESYTTYGTFRKATGFTWATVGTVYPTWGVWNDPWNAGQSTLLQPQVIGGNQQGFVLVRENGTGEGNSLYIQNIVGSTVTSPNHCLNNGDYIIISGALGTVGAQVNNQIFSVSLAQTDTFVLNPVLSTGLTYLGGGVIKRMYVPFIQTKQFPSSWSMGRKTRIGPQQYLLTTTDDAQITLQIYLSQDSTNAYNSGPIVPTPNSVNNGLIYSTVLFTCVESANLGLTPPNTNLQMIANINSSATNASSPQQQIWHRMNTSLIGDTIQIGFTLSDTQMRDIEMKSQFEEIELHSMILDISPSSLLA